MATRNSIAEEASALGERAKGAGKDAAGVVTYNRSLERGGERENRAGRERQTANNHSDQWDSTRGAATGARQSWLTGTFADRDSAERAYNLMLSRGYSEKEINLMMSDETRKRYFSDEKATDSEPGNKTMESAGFGGAIGVTAGAILGAVAVIAIPGLGLVVAGPIAGALAGAGAGGLAGGIIGALIGWGIPEERGKLYESELKNGSIVLGVSPRNDDNDAYFEGEWKAYNGRNIYR
jgi:uncharacterized protein YjbJ (UPF0337 family)